MGDYTCTFELKERKTLLEKYSIYEVRIYWKSVQRVSNVQLHSASKKIQTHQENMSPRYRTEMPVQSVQSVKSQSNIFAAEVFSRNVSLVNAS